jgi:serine/threonine protein kinase/formylglycine-generating enzyme required for sulfatase activity
LAEWTIFLLSAIFISARGTKMARIDKYEIIEEIGRGGMGAVYKALHPQFKKYVAIKEVRADLANNPDILQRFEQEVELLAQLPTHPNIVTVRDALVWEDKLYIVMDYIEGETLGDLTHEGNLSSERGAALLEQILSGLEAIHSRGIVHRDLKANNILIDHAGNAFITDFGIAEYTNSESNAITMATPRYAAPELINKQMRRGGTDQQIDIYAAGMLAYEMLLGENAFRRALPDIYDGERGGSADNWLQWHVSLARPAKKLHELNPLIPQRLAKIVARMMEKDVALRYREVREIRNDLSPLLGKKPDAATRLQDMQTHFDETVPMDRTQAGKTNLVGPDTAALYQTRPIVPEDSQPPPSVVTRPNAGVATAATPAVPSVDTAPTTEREKNRSSMIWVTVGGVALVALIFCAWWLWPSSGFTLILRGTPANSAVLIDGTNYGLTDASGTLTIKRIDSGKRTVRVVNEGFKDFLAVVEAQKGTEQILIANLERVDSETPIPLPNEMDYTGAMVLIPAGDFIMGDDTNRPEEKPAHTVNLPNYYIDKFEVTNEQYKKFCDETKHPYPTNTTYHREYFTNQAKGPVIGVSYEDAAEYAKWANKRLPTEEEWEKAASWDDKTKKKRQWPWGDKGEADRAQFLPPNLKPGEEPKPAAVGQFPKGASAYGVMDMAGNAGEWVDAFFQPYPGNQKSDPNFGTRYRVIRGGNFAQGLNDGRTTRRLFVPPDYKEKSEPVTENGVTINRELKTSFGFRCAISANDAKVQAYLRKR